METGPARDRKSAQSGYDSFAGATGTPPSSLDRNRSPSQSIWPSSLACPEAFHYGFKARPHRLSPLAPPQSPEPHLLRPRPASRCTQDISPLLTSVFRNLYTAEALGEDVSASLIKARGSEDARHEEFVDELQQIRELYKQRLDEFEMLERHLIQARARALAEKERDMHRAKVQVLEPFIKMPPVKTIFRWCVDNQLLQKHHLICPDDYYSDTVPFCSAPKGTSVPGYSKLTFSCEKHSRLKKELTKKAEASCKKTLAKPEDELDYTMDSLAWDSSSKARLKTKRTVKKASPPKNKHWMNHLRMPQRHLERALLARMESRNHFLKNPRFFPPNTPHGGKSLVFPPRKPALMGAFRSGELGQRGVGRHLAPHRREEAGSPAARPAPGCAHTPVFVAEPPVGFFTDYEIGSVYEMVLSLQNTTATSRHLRVLPPATPYFSLGLGMFPGEGGMVAPGMTCQYVVQFLPDCLGDFDDFLSVETQSAHRLRIPLQARRPPPVLTLSPVLDCGYCLIGGIKVTRFLCKNVGFSAGKFCIMPQASWPPPCFRAAVSLGLVESPPFGILPSAFELVPGQALELEVLFLPTSPGQAKQTFIIVCDNCQIKELVTSGIGQLVALDLIYISGEKSQPEPGELTDLTAQHFIRFEPENLQSTASKQLIIRNATHVELAFHWQIIKPNLQSLVPGEVCNTDGIKLHPDRETAFCITPERGLLTPHADHEFLLSFSPHELRAFHSVLQMVLEGVPEPLSAELEDRQDPSYSVHDVIVLEIEVKGSAEPFRVLLEPYALIIPGENYIGINVKKDFKMWNNSKSPIRYTWRKISDCHIIEVEPCMGTIEPSEVEAFELKFTGGAPGPASQDLLCDIRDSPWPVVLHIEAAFKGPALLIGVPALEFGLLRRGQKATKSILIQNLSPLPAAWRLRESPEERQEGVSPFEMEPSGGQVPPLGQCSVNVTLEALQCQRLQTVLVLEVASGAWSYLPAYAEIQEPHVYLQSSQVELSTLYLGVPTKAALTLVNGTLLPTEFHWGKLLGHQASFCTADVSPGHGTLGPREELQLSLELTTHTRDALSALALPCTVSGMEEPLVLGISGKPRGLQVAITVTAEGSGSSPEPGHEQQLRLDFGPAVPLWTCVERQLVLTNRAPVQAPFALAFEHFGDPPHSRTQKPGLPDVSPALLKTARIRKQLARREHLAFMENMLSHGKGAAFFLHVPQGTLGAHQQLRVGITGCANMWGEYRDSLVCTVGDLPPSVIPVHMTVVGCPLSCVRTNCTTDQFQKEHVIRFGTHVSGGDTVTRVLRLSNSSPCDIRLDWRTYAPEDRADRLLELLVFYGPPFPLLHGAGSDLPGPEAPESSSSGSLSLSDASVTSHETAQPAEGSSGNTEIISVLLQGHEGVPCDHLYHVSPEQVVVPAGGSSALSVSFSPEVLGPSVLHKVKCMGYALGFMSLDDEVERELPGRRRRPQGFAVEPLRLDLLSYVRPAQLCAELDSAGGMDFRLQASDLIPEQPCSGVLSELVTARRLKLTNATETPLSFRLLVSGPFSVAQGGAPHSPSAPGPGWGQECEDPAPGGRQLLLRPQENMLVSVCFSLSLELLSYQRLPADQMLPGVDIRQSASGEREMVFTQNLLLEYANRTTQVVPLRATVAVPELQLSTSWLDFGTCFVNQGRVQEIYLMNQSRCRSYWTVLMRQQRPDKDPVAFEVSPSSGMLEARPVNAPPTFITLQVLFTARGSEPYESTLVVEGVLGEKACTLRLRGQGSYDERYVSPC